MPHRRVQNTGEAILSVRTKSNSGSRASTACTIACVIAAAAMAPGKWNGSLLSAGTPIDVQKILAGVEDRYNRIQTLQVTFSESFTMQNRKRTQKGELYLRKP